MNNCAVCGDVVPPIQVNGVGTFTVCEWNGKERRFVLCVKHTARLRAFMAHMNQVYRDNLGRQV